MITASRNILHIADMSNTPLPADITSIAAADIVHEILSLFIASSKHATGTNRAMEDEPEVPTNKYMHNEL
jgi:hypothetical protein